MRININGMRDIREIYDQLEEKDLIKGEYAKVFWREQLLSDIRKMNNIADLREIRMPLPLPLASIMVIDKFPIEDKILRVNCSVSNNIVKKVEVV